MRVILSGAGTSGRLSFFSARELNRARLFSPISNTDEFRLPRLINWRTLNFLMIMQGETLL